MDTAYSRRQGISVSFKCNFPACGIVLQRIKGTYTLMADLRSNGMARNRCAYNGSPKAMK